MRVLLLTFLQIALLRQGPQILPASRFLVGLLLLAHWLVGLLLASLSESLELALGLSLFGTVTMVIIVQLLLNLHRYPSRLWQTLSALAAAEVLIGLLAIPATLIFQSGGELQHLGALVSLLLFVWNLLLAGHILRHALTVSQGVGLLYAVGYVAVSLSLSGLVFGGG